MFRHLAPPPLIMVTVKSARGTKKLKRLKVHLTCGRVEAETSLSVDAAQPTWGDKFWFDGHSHTVLFKLRHKSWLGILATLGTARLSVEQFRSGEQASVRVTIANNSGRAVGELSCACQLMFYNSVIVPPDSNEELLNFGGKLGVNCSTMDLNQLLMTPSQIDLCSAVAESQKAMHHPRAHIPHHHAAMRGFARQQMHEDLPVATPVPLPHYHRAIPVSPVVDEDQLFCSAPPPPHPPPGRAMAAPPDYHYEDDNQNLQQGAAVSRPPPVNPAVLPADGGADLEEDLGEVAAPTERELQLLQELRASNLDISPRMSPCSCCVRQEEMSTKSPAESALCVPADPSADISAEREGRSQ